MKNLTDIQDKDITLAIVTNITQVSIDEPDQKSL